MYEPLVASNQTWVKEEHDTDEGRARCPAGLRSAGKLLATLIHQAVAWSGTVVAAERERGDRAVRAVGSGTGAAVTRAYAAGCTGREKFIRQADAASGHFP